MNIMKVILEVDNKEKIATLLKLGTSEAVAKTELVNVKILEKLGLSSVVVDLGDEDLDLEEEEQVSVCDYIINHTLNNNVYKLAVATMDKDNDKTKEVINKMIES